MADGVFATGLSFAYHRGTPVLVDVDLALPAGSFTAVIGPNGCGKSTLLRVLAGSLVPAAGVVSVGGIDPAATSERLRARRIAYLPQSEPDDVPFTALELVLMGRFPYQGLMPFDRASDIAVAMRSLEEVAAANLATRLLTEMSGGERQRVHLARALAQEPAVLLLDEPATSLDLRHQAETWRLLGRLHREAGRTLVVVSHDLNLPGAHADHVAILAEGRIRAVGPPAEILRAEQLEAVYGTRILETKAPGHERPFLVVAP